MKLVEIIVRKLTSGKFLLTLIGGVVFAWGAVTGKISGEAVATIVTAVFISYFQKGKTDGDTLYNNDDK